MSILCLHTINDARKYLNIESFLKLLDIFIEQNVHLISNEENQDNDDCTRCKYELMKCKMCKMKESKEP
ncbi:8976_t:CDS:1, partial [Gigaspora rosea]